MLYNFHHTILLTNQMFQRYNQMQRTYLYLSATKYMTIYEHDKGQIFYMYSSIRHFLHYICYAFFADCTRFHVNTYKSYNNETPFTNLLFAHSSGI